MIKKIINNILQKQNLWVVLLVLFIQIILFVTARVVIDPYTDKPTCAVCGRANTKPVKTLWEFKPGFIEEKSVYYCKKHIKNAPRMISKLPSDDDTVLKGFWLAATLSSLLLLILVFMLALMELDFKWLFIHSGLTLPTIGYIGVAADASSVIFFFALIAIPMLMIYLWNKSASR